MDNQASVSEQGFVLGEEEEEDSGKTSFRQLISQQQMDSSQEDRSTRKQQPEINGEEEMDSFQEDGSTPKQPQVNGEEEQRSPKVDANSKNTNEEIIKELKNIKRQNFVTHCLLSAMIMLTLTWQISEVSMILKIKNGLSNPLKLLGGITKGFLLKDRPEDAQEPAANGKKGIEPPQLLPALKIPEIPLLDFPIFYGSDDD